MDSNRQKGLPGDPGKGPYPKRYGRWISIKGGQRVFLRPIRPADGPAISSFFSRISPRSVYFRFLTHLERLPPALLHHLVHIDYPSEFALAAFVTEPSGEALIGVCRYAAVAGSDTVELAIVIRDDWQGKGLGKRMVLNVVEAARKNGFAKVSILIDPRNEAMQGLFMGLGYPCVYETSLIDICDRMEIVI